MNTGMKMYLLTNTRKGGSERFGERMGYSDLDSPNSYNSTESRFSDRRGRDRYENGRYAPQDRYDDVESNYRHPEMNMNRYGSSAKMTMGGGERMNQIGFRTVSEMENTYQMNAGYESRNEMDHRSAPMYMGKGEYSAKLTKEMADEWMYSLQNEDGTQGPHWTLEQTKQVMAQKGVKADPFEFFAVLNAMYADYCKVFKKHGVGDKLDFYVDMAKAFIDDKDASEGKVVKYFENIVK